MKFPLTPELLGEATRFELRSACGDCFYWRRSTGECWHGWPDEGQRRWPLDAPAADGTLPAHVAFCKEFELK